jgi:hypothetical protein
MNNLLIVPLVVPFLACLTFCEEDPPGLEQMAHKVAIKEHSREEWARYVKAAKARYAEWEKDGQGGSMGSFLNSRLLDYAVPVPGGKLKDLKRFVFWLALYVELDETPPKYIRDISPKHRAEAQKLLKDFSWEKLQKMVRDKSKDYDGVVPED